MIRHALLCTLLILCGLAQAYPPVIDRAPTATVIGRNAAGTGPVQALTPSAARTVLGLGTAATANTGTSGATIPLLNAANTWSAAQDFSANVRVGDATTARPFILDGPAAAARAVRITTANALRWQMGTNGAAESGSDTGAPFGIYAYTDAGAFIDTPIGIIRAAGGPINISRPTAFGANAVSGSNVAFTGGSITGITDLAVADGGTGASSASAARTNLGATTVGSNLFTLANPGAISFPKINADNTVSAESASVHRTSLGLGTAATANTGTSGSVVPLANGANTWSAAQTFNGSVTVGDGTGGRAVTLNGGAAARNFNFENAGILRWLFGISGAEDARLQAFDATGTLIDTVWSVPNAAGSALTINRPVSVGANALTASNVAITGGSISGITDLAIADGGTGASTAAAARTNLLIRSGRVTTGSIGAAASALVTLTWSTTFADTNYSVTCSVQDSTAATAALRLVHIETIAAATVAARVENTSAGSLTGTLHCTGVHD